MVVYLIMKSCNIKCQSHILNILVMLK
uniref:Uncharacterized protein n=1 Tax=Anguilla anguilla TaxID=7936 RepID=A0A0E9RPM7_ANGAN